MVFLSQFQLYKYDQQSQQNYLAKGRHL